MPRLLSAKNVGRGLVVVEEEWKQDLLHCKNIERQAAELGVGGGNNTQSVKPNMMRIIYFWHVQFECMTLTVFMGLFFRKCLVFTCKSWLPLSG